MAGFASADISIVIPAKNEIANISEVVGELKSLYPDAEIVVVDDGSEDETANAAMNSGARVVSHPYSKGNGAAVKTGARTATRDVIVFMDGDGQHQPKDVGMLLGFLKENVDMVVGARGKASQAGLGRSLANKAYNLVASYMVGHKVDDLTSGFRVARAEKFREHLHLLPNGFSYPTTITMAFFRAGYSVAYVPIHCPERGGRSHISPFKDGARFLLIIFRVATLYSPLKVFFPLAFAHIFLGLAYYLYTYLTHERFTNMSMLLLSLGVIIFLIGLISEQITNLNYKHDRHN